MFFDLMLLIGKTAPRIFIRNMSNIGGSRKPGKVSSWQIHDALSTVFLCENGNPDTVYGTGKV